MARPGRFERPTSGSGDQRSIQLSYGRAAGTSSQVLIEKAHNKEYLRRPYSISFDLLAPACTLPLALAWPNHGTDHPIARDRIPFASLSISSAFLSMATESTWTESVFSTSAFNSLAS